MFVFYDWPFPHVYFSKPVAYFPVNSWLFSPIVTCFVRILHKRKALPTVVRLLFFATKILTAYRACYATALYSVHRALDVSGTQCQSQLVIRSATRHFTRVYGLTGGNKNAIQCAA